MTSLLSFIKIANDEHDALSEYCNALSLLSREINKSQPPEISQLSAEDPMYFIPQENEVESALVHYTSCLKNLKLRPWAKLIPNKTKSRYTAPIAELISMY